MARRKPGSNPQISTLIDDDEWKRVIADDQNPEWHYDYVQGRIADVEERLHYRLLWQRIGRLWLFAGNLILLVLAILANFTPIAAAANISKSGMRLAPYLYTIFFGSTILASVLTYRQYKRTRELQFALKRLALIRRRKLAEKAETAANVDGDPALSHQKRYRDDAPDIISQYREEANRNRRIHNRLQVVIIGGSVTASTVTTASVSYSVTRWYAVGVTAAVGLAAGFAGYFKFHERSSSAQQTADSIEREYEAVELRVGRYRGLNEKDAYSSFAECVEKLRDEQNKRQQQLDQPSDIKREE
ncbi:DUF4231 domain-containing protein [Dactylosporangium sp. CA-092794]|uniref:DUF4231 domain-containing protein n=1 Tax=Dactylosporangium sp. CA-092794 TaxID=3239929 RepID=UPI003D8B7D45